MSLLHEIGITEQELFRCDMCGEEWLFNPLMFKNSSDSEKQSLAICPGPKWVQQNYVCRTMWQQDVTWREHAVTVAEDDSERQQMMIRLARHAAGGSEGQAHEQ